MFKDDLNIQNYYLCFDEERLYLIWVKDLLKNEELPRNYYLFTKEMELGGAS